MMLSAGSGRRALAVAACATLAAACGAGLGWPASPARAEAAETAAAAPTKSEVRPGVWFEVVELRRMPDKGIVGLTFAVDNRSDKAVTLAELGISDNERRVTDLKLIDFQGGKDYGIGSTGGDCLCSTFPDGGPVEPGARREFWAWFGAPPAGVAKLAVFVPGAPPMFDVPLAR